MADGAGRREKRLALRGVAFAFDDGEELRDGLLLRLRLRVQFREHVGGAFGHAFVGMRAETRGRGWAELRHVHGVALQRVEESERPVGALEQCVKSGSLHVGGQFFIGGGKRGAHAHVVRFAECGDEAALEAGRAGGELFHHGGENRGVAAAEADETARSGETRGVVGLCVGDGGKERSGEFGDLALERTGLVPLRGEREHAGIGSTHEQLGERGGKFRRHRGRVFEFAEFFENRALECIGAGGFARERDDEFRRSVHIVPPCDGTGELPDELRELRRISAVERSRYCRIGIFV